MEKVVFKKSFRVEFGETLSMGNYQSIKPGISSSVEYDLENIPEGLSEDVFKEQFTRKVRQDYFKLKEDAVKDFVDFSAQIGKMTIPAKR